MARASATSCGTEWNNLSLTNVIFAILVIGVVGMLLDLAFVAQKVVTYVWRMLPSARRPAPAFPDANDHRNERPLP